MAISCNISVLESLGRVGAFRSAAKSRVKSNGINASGNTRAQSSLVCSKSRSLGAVLNHRRQNVHHSLQNFKVCAEWTFWELEFSALTLFWILSSRTFWDDAKRGAFSKSSETQTHRLVIPKLFHAIPCPLWTRFLVGNVVRRTGFAKETRKGATSSGDFGCRSLGAG